LRVTLDAKRPIPSDVIVYAVVDDGLWSGCVLGDSLDVFVRRENAERSREDIRSDDSELVEGTAHRG
jgi:hypothetical protein